MESSDLLSEDNQATDLPCAFLITLIFQILRLIQKSTDRLNIGWFDKSVKEANQERFSLTLTGSFVAKEAGLHTFSLSSVGQARLYMDGKVLIDNWNSYVHGAKKRLFKENLPRGKR